MKQATYAEIRDQIRQGDIVAFGGRGFVSDAIKFFTRSPISHVGIVLETKLALSFSPGVSVAQEGRIVMLIESTTLNGQNGVQVNRLSERVDSYDGNVWWLPLSDEIRAKCDWKRFFDRALHQVGKAYDYHQVGGFLWGPLSRIPFLGRLFRNERNTGKLYCSELACLCFEEAGALPLDVNYSGTSPERICEYRLYGTLTQIKGKPTEIPKFNTRAV